MNELVVLISLKKADDIICPPFALMFVSSALKKEGYRVQVIHSSLEEAEKNISEVVAENPLFIGFSLFTGVYCKYSAILSEKIKNLNSKIPLVWGGVHASLLTEQCLKEEWIDIVIFREGEDTVVEVANALRDKKPLTGVAGIGFKEQGKMVMNNKREFIKNLADYPLDWECINVNDYVEEKTVLLDGKETKLRSIGYYSSRGCPFNCAFCYNLGYNDKTWRGAPADFVIQDIRNLKDKHGFNHITFWDDLFFVNRKRAFDILKGSDVYSDSEVRLDFVTDENVQEFKKNKVVYFLVGAESGSDRILKMINKGFDSKFMLEKVKILAKHNIYVQYSFILGIPTETKEETYQTIDHMYQIYKIHPLGSFTVGIYMPYPGTPLYELAIKEGYVPPTTTKGWESVDRWRNTVKLPWIDSVMCLHIRLIFSLLTSQYMPTIAKKWLELRIKKKWLYSKYDLKFLVLLNDVLKEKNYNFKSLRDTLLVGREMTLRILQRLSASSSAI